MGTSLWNLTVLVPAKYRRRLCSTVPTVPVCSRRMIARKASTLFRNTPSKLKVMRSFLSKPPFF